jgi:signal transduction histidine kinase
MNEPSEMVVSIFSLNTLVEEMVMRYNSAFKEKGNVFEIDIPNNFICRYDPAIIRVILFDLLINANKFTSQGTIGIEASMSNANIVIVVTDGGIGMPERKRQVIKEIESSSKLSFEGEAWVKRYRVMIQCVELFDGKIHIAERGQRVAITISLPPLETVK